jgi:hypothetical protein
LAVVSLMLIFLCSRIRIAIALIKEASKWVLKRFFFLSVRNFTRSQHSAVSIVTGYRLNDRGVEVWVSVGLRIFYSPHHPGRFWGPPSVLSSGHLGQFPWE